MKLQRSPGIYFEWSGDTLVARHVNSHIKCHLGIPVVELLNRLENPQEENELLDSYPPNSRADVRATLQGLLQGGFLREIPAEQSESVLAGTEGWWEAWGTQARAFHFASRDANFASFRGERARQLADQLAQAGPAPLIAKRCPGAPRIPLPPVQAAIDEPLGHVLETRRTHRQFHDSPVSLDTFSTVLHYSFAPLGYQDTGAFGTQMVKASPAGGSRHDGECYPACFRVEGVLPGLYHYDACGHALELVRPDFPPELVLELTAGQDHCARSAFTCFLTTVPERITYKYCHPRAYRMWMYNVGYVGQTFALVCTALGLGAFETAAFDDTRVEQALDVDPRQEFAAFILGAGVPVLTEQGLPPDFHPVPPP
ncbi:SagB/ThcOx family dehydrogenase (plasmid) [Streptomyces sp. CA-142005]|uniref:SagB/ThcOx family dehydrogenase n=1 Tax=Streptomyces sp. CA-142005 TaxID=3240052 RepID=UPI003D9297D8